MSIFQMAVRTVSRPRRARSNLRGALALVSPISVDSVREQLSSLTVKEQTDLFREFGFTKPRVTRKAVVRPTAEARHFKCFGPTDARLEAWLEEHHDPNWKPKRIVHRKITVPRMSAQAFKAEEQRIADYVASYERSKVAGVAS